VLPVILENKPFALEADSPAFCTAYPAFLMPSAALRPPSSPASPICANLAETSEVSAPSY